MRQKFLIFQSGKNDNLNIRELAVINKDFQRVESSLLRDHHYTVLCEERYDGDVITEAVTEGIPAVIAAIRTPSLFPVKAFSVKIAESVISLYASKSDRSVELMFDDVSLVDVPAE